MSKELKELAYKQPIGGVPATVLRLLLSVAGAFTKKITHLPSRQMIDGFLNSFQELVAVLSDANPEDDKQIKAVVNKFLTNGEFYKGSRQTLLLNIEKIANEDARLALTIAMGVLYQLADRLTDETDDNGEQLKEMLQTFLQGADGVQFVTSLLTLMVGKDTANIIALLLIEALKGILQEDQSAALIDLRERLMSESI